jgi:hypothetical protein
MKLMGAPAVMVDPIVRELEVCAFKGLPALVFCNGEDCTAVLGEEGDTVEQLVKLAARVVPLDA